MNHKAGQSDTIAALATPAGRGGVGIIRVSGPNSAEIGHKILGKLPAPRQAEYLSFLDHDGKVLDTGLWAYSRHPNYFGEFLIWWGYFLFALSAGAWWTVFSPLLMTLLLFKVSGVSLMEKGITERRANYREYIESTNAFFPGRPRRSSVYIEGGQES